MKWAALFFAGVFAAQGAVVSETWRAGTLSLTLDDGAATIEWISAATFRIGRSWGGPLPAQVPISHEPVLVARQDTGGVYRMRSRYLVVELDPNAMDFRVSAGDTKIVAGSVRDRATGAPDLALNPLGKQYGGRSGFFFTPDGYGISRLSAERPHAIEFVVYYGPSPKEILEQRHLVRRLPEIKADALAVKAYASLPEWANLIPSAILVWEGLEALTELLVDTSMSGELYPAVSLALWGQAPAEVRQRALDLAAVLPFVVRGQAAGNVDRATRDAFLPYLTTYLRESHDRGFPIVRPVLLQFPKDAGADEYEHEFMLGDEFLVAPVIAPGDKRTVKLPRGLWTDLRTNIEYRGNQTIEIEAPPGRVPMLARNGSLFPMAARNHIELHYMPSLGGEFFLWEPGIEAISQFHAAPAGDYLRAEIETKVTRTYEWVLHHTRTPSEVGEEGMPYVRVNARTALRAGTWWHDGRLNNLHVMLRATAGSDRIVNVMFP